MVLSLIALQIKQSGCGTLAHVRRYHIYRILVKYGRSYGAHKARVSPQMLPVGRVRL